MIGRASATEDVLDVWRTPDAPFARQWEERFGADVLGPVAARVAKRALEAAGVEPGDLAAFVVDAANPRIAKDLPRSLGASSDVVAEDLGDRVGRSGAAHALLLLARALDGAKPGDRIAIVVAVDGVDACVLEVGSGVDAGRPDHAVDDWIASKRDDLGYTAFPQVAGHPAVRAPATARPGPPGRPLPCTAARAGSSRCWGRAARRAGA